MSQYILKEINMKYTNYDGKFKYYLQPNEIENYKKLYIQNKGRIDIRMFDYWLTNHFQNIHQNAFNRIRAVCLQRDSITKKEIKELIVKFEQDEIKDTEYEFLGIENNIRINSFVRNIINFLPNMKCQLKDN